MALILTRWPILRRSNVRLFSDDALLAYGCTVRMWTSPDGAAGADGYIGFQDGVGWMRRWGSRQFLHLPRG